MASAEPCLQRDLEQWRSLEAEAQREEKEQRGGEEDKEVAESLNAEVSEERRDGVSGVLDNNVELEKYDEEEPSEGEKRGPEDWMNLQRRDEEVRRQESSLEKPEREKASEERNKIWEESKCGKKQWTDEWEERQKEHLNKEARDVEENSIKVYSKDSYAEELFRTLEELRGSSLLTDLTLSTEDGLSLRVHSPVLAAVSSLVHHRLQERDGRRERRDESLVLGPEVGRAGLAGVLEFAYTGAIAAPNRDRVVQIQAAAHALGVPRVLELCREVEEEEEEGGGRKTEERKISAVEQMKISFLSIRQLWAQRVGCDTGGGGDFVSRVVLAASSDYFRGMFTSGMRESQQPRVTLPFLVASELEALIGCSYSGALLLSWGRVFEVTCATLQLQFQPALSLCLDFLRQEMDPRSCLDVASFAEAYGAAELLKAADDFVLRNFQKVADDGKFLDLPAEKLLRFLRSQSLCVPSELVVFKAVASWIEANPKTRRSLSRELIKNVQFPLMTFREFEEVQAVTMWREHNMESVYRSTFKEFCSNSKDPHTQHRVYLTKDSVVLVGGEQMSEDFTRRTASRELWFGNSLRNYTGMVKNVEWRKLGDMPEMPRSSHEVAALAGKLYVVGGRSYYGVDGILNSAFRYNPIDNSWQRLADMQGTRCSFSMVVVDSVIYAIGGHTDSQTNLDSVECYSPNTNSWSFARPLDMSLSGHSASVLDGQIFVSGGFNCSYQCLASTFLYHPERGTTYLADMKQDRALHCTETLGRRLYAVGGVCNLRKFYTDLLSCEVYDVATDSWSALPPLPVTHVGAASAVLEGRLYVLGGYCLEDYSETRLVHRYDPSGRRWENMGGMPGPNTDIRACVLRLPAHLRL